MLASTGLAPGRDFNLISINFNPAATSGDARGLRDEEMQLYPELRQSLTMLMPAPDAIANVSRALGFNVVPDADADRYAHPAVLYVLTPQGRVAAVLDALSVQGDALRSALVSAGEGRIGSLPERLHVLCYGLLPWPARRTGWRRRCCEGGAALMLLGAGAFVVVLRRRRMAL